LIPGGIFASSLKCFAKPAPGARKKDSPRATIRSSTPNCLSPRRHADEPAMHHVGGVIREPLDFAFHARADGRVQPGELRVGFAAYFDLVGHGRWRDFQDLNLPAKSSRRAARSSARMPGCCAVSQS
jgi:hypothetical protein